MFILNDGETLLINIQAYYQKGNREGAVGDLRVTNQRTIFESKRVSLLQETIEFLNEDIFGVEDFNYLHFIKDGLKITLKSGQEYKFSLTDREKVISILNNISLTRPNRNK